MRLDKYLKVSRIIKRRTVARDAGLKQRILVNQRIAKPATDVKVGDIITVNYYQKTLTLKVKSIENFIKKEDAENMYEIIKVVENHSEV